jgi:hypothetical protein
METRAWSSDDREGLHDSFRSPAHVPRIDKQTFPSSYRFLEKRSGEKKTLREEPRNGTYGFTIKVR